MKAHVSKPLIRKAFAEDLELIAAFPQRQVTRQARQPASRFGEKIVLLGSLVPQRVDDGVHQDGLLIELIPRRRNVASQETVPRQHCRARRERPKQPSFREIVVTSQKRGEGSEVDDLVTNRRCYAPEVVAIDESEEILAYGSSDATQQCGGEQALLARSRTGGREFGQFARRSKIVLEPRGMRAFEQRDDTRAGLSK